MQISASAPRDSSAVAAPRPITIITPTAAVRTAGGADPQTYLAKIKIDHGGGRVGLDTAGGCPDLLRVLDPKLAIGKMFLGFLHKRWFEDAPPLLDRGAMTGENNANSVVPLFISPAHVEQALGEASPDVAEAARELFRDVIFPACEAHAPAASALQGTWNGGAVSCVVKDDSKLAMVLKCCRFTAPVNIPDPGRYGIPTEPDLLYLFVQNHPLAAEVSEETAGTWADVAAGLMGEESPSVRDLGHLLSVIQAGGFVYNKKVSTGPGSYLPETVGVAAILTAPAFEGQAAISTGVPIAVPPGYVSFFDTAPVTIRGLKTLSRFHGRYGLMPTAAIYRCPGDELRASVLCPLGGFYYVPDSFADFTGKRWGALVYPFGETEADFAAGRAASALRSEDDAESSRPEEGPASLDAPAPPQAPSENSRNMCVICLDEPAVMLQPECGQLTRCEECYGQRHLETCPACRVPLGVGTAIRAYL